MRKDNNPYSYCEPPCVKESENCVSYLNLERQTDHTTPIATVRGVIIDAMHSDCMTEY